MNAVAQWWGGLSKAEKFAVIKRAGWFAPDPDDWWDGRTPDERAAAWMDSTPSEVADAFDGAHSFRRICDLLGNPDDPEQVVREMIACLSRVVALGSPVAYPVRLRAAEILSTIQLPENDA